MTDAAASQGVVGLRHRRGPVIITEKEEKFRDNFEADKFGGTPRKFECQFY